ncbi:MAG: hypothetical protein AAF757_31475 [Cyanobacteria bacterium P01_D01_bin.116]
MPVAAIPNTNRINSVAFSPDGKVIATAAANNNPNIWLWNAKTGECLNICEGHTNWVHSISWKSDCTSIVSVSSERSIRVWDTKTGNCLKTLLGHSNIIRSVTWSHDNKFIASAGDDKAILLWDANEGICLKRLEGRANASKFKLGAAPAAPARMCDTPSRRPSGYRQKYI